MNHIYNRALYIWVRKSKWQLVHTCSCMTCFIMITGEGKHSRGRHEPTLTLGIVLQKPRIIYIYYRNQINNHNELVANRNMKQEGHVRHELMIQAPCQLSMQAYAWAKHSPLLLFLSTTGYCNTIALGRSPPSSLSASGADSFALFAVLPPIFTVK